MTAPRWCRALLVWLAPDDAGDDVLGDIEEFHRRHVGRQGRVLGSLRTVFDTLDMARALIVLRIRKQRGEAHRTPERRRRGPLFTWLDFKLGLRMLVRYPGLTLVGGFAMAFAIWVGAATFETVRQMVRPTLPLEDGDRIVGIVNADAANGGVETRILRDFADWRASLRAVELLGAFRTVERNLIVGDGPGEPLEIAEISASAFRLTRVTPLLGRFLQDADERPDAAAVLVIGHEVWRTRFAADSSVTDRTVRLGNTQATIVGVMPEGFGFPVSHVAWAPFRLNALDYERGEGPAIMVFGRLGRGATMDAAQAELTRLGERAAADHPRTHATLRPQVMPYAQSVTGLDPEEQMGIDLVNAFVVMLLILVFANVALLMFARATTRESEIVVRSALGASRSRIIRQLFVEALVLGGFASVIGLAAVGYGLRWWLGVREADLGARLPFWFSDSVAPVTVLYTVGLTVLGAAIAGAVPALKLTRAVGHRLRTATAGGGGLRFGGVWTAVIVFQVAMTVAFPATAFFARRYVAETQTMDVGFPAQQYLSARLAQDGVGSRAVYQELARRLAEGPGVLGVTFTDRLPGTYHPQRWIELDDVGAAADSALVHRVGPASVDPDWFDVLDARILSGRGFVSGDVGVERGPVIVNESFVKRVLGGRNPIGRRLRYAADNDTEPGPWHEIVGVVNDLGMFNGDAAEDAGFYHAAAPGEGSAAHVVLHLRDPPDAFVPLLRTIAAGIDPGLHLHDIRTLDQVSASLWLEMDFIARVLAGISVVALVLSLAAIYSVMSFTVSRRTREIGIRVALGADARRIILAIFRQPLLQVAAGIATGGMLVGALSFGILRAGLWPVGIGLVVAYAALMMGVCMLACIVPTRRALRIEPTEALRAEG